MIDKINLHQTQEYLAKQLSNNKQPDSARNCTDNDVDVLLKVNYASLIDKASQITQNDNEALQRARELLLNGQLESPENIRAAAENIAKFGI